MPFESEKQRRFMWAEHPAIAKRWAKEYPTKRNLPMYAQNQSAPKNHTKTDKKEVEKASAIRALNRSLAVYSSKPIVKKSDSILEKVNVPHSDKPVAAGDEHATVERENPTQNCSQKPDQTTAPNQAPMKPIADLRAAEMSHKLAALLTKYSVDIRLGKKHKHMQDKPDNSPANKGIDFKRIQQEAQAEKQRRAWANYWASVMPQDSSGKAKKQDSAPVVATNPGMNNKPNMASNETAGMSGKVNPVGLKGPLNTKGGVPTMEQNVTGNAAFGN